VNDKEEEEEEEEEEGFFCERNSRSAERNYSLYVRTGMTAGRKMTQQQRLLVGACPTQLTPTAPFLVVG